MLKMPGEEAVYGVAPSKVSLMNKDIKMKLRILLHHWIEHNREHGQEFRDWAEKAKGTGETEASKEILRAAKEMEKASESLSQALKSLEKKER